MVAQVVAMSNIVIIGPYHLYKKDSTGKVRRWTISIEDDGTNHIIKTKHGLVGGAVVEDKGIVVSAGKAGRTLAEQSKLQFDSKINKKTDDGYTTNTTGIGVMASQRVNAMLAQNYEKHGHKIPLPAIAQPKLDGVRCLAQVLPSGDVALVSRNNKPFPEMPGIRAAIKAVGLRPGTILDGELYSTTLGATPAENFQKVVGLTRRSKLTPQDVQDSKEVSLNIFDLIKKGAAQMPFIKRYKLASDYANKDTTGRLTMVPNYLVKTKQDIDNLLAQNLANGYEGVMIRDPKSVYEGRRSYRLQKYKKFDTEEFEVVGFEEGQGNDVGTVIWVCKTPQGKTFTVRPMGTRAAKQQMFQNATDYIGAMLTVKFQDYTVAGIPRFPVGVTFRDYE